MTQEALKLALEALYPIAHNTTDDPRGQANKAITAIKEALAQPEQALTGQDIAALVTGMEVSIDVSTGDHDSGHRLFGVVDLVQQSQGSKHGLILLVQETKANFKEALAQTQEPVQFKCTVIDDVHPNGIPLEQWTPPPQRTWVGLTDEDRKQIKRKANYHWEMTAGEYAERIGQLTEAKLKEANT